MVVVSEWLANPKGQDAIGEWIELYNSGEGEVDLSGWQLRNAAGKHASITGSIGPGQFRVFPRQQTHLSLRNSAESVRLYDAAGRLQSELSFAGTVAEGKSVIARGPQSVLSTPTPGGAAVFEAQASSIAHIITEPGVVVGAAGHYETLALFAVATLLCPAAAFILLLKSGYGVSDNISTTDPPAGKSLS